MRERVDVPSSVYSEGTSNYQYPYRESQKDMRSLQRASWCRYSFGQGTDRTVYFRRPDVGRYLRLQLCTMTLISIKALQLPDSGQGSAQVWCGNAVDVVRSCSR